MAKRVFQAAFGVWLLAMFVMTLFGWRPPESMLSEQGARWVDVNLRPDLIAAILLMYGIGAATFLSNRFVALGAAILAPLAVNMAMYHAFVNQKLIPGGLIATVFCVCVAASLWLNRASYKPLLQANPETQN